MGAPALRRRRLRDGENGLAITANCRGGSIFRPARPTSTDIKGDTVDIAG